MKIARFGARPRLLAPAALLLAATAVLTACNRDRNAAGPRRPEVIASLPLIPHSNLVDTTGTPEAERRGYIVVIPFDSSVKFYPDTLRKLGWTIENSHQGNETLDLYARKDKNNLWIRMEGQLWGFGVRRTYYTIIAAEATAHHDSTPPQPLAPRHAVPAVN